MKLASRRGSVARSTVRWRSGRRASSRSIITLSSSRASWLPRQKWAPKPKAMCGLGLRVMSNVSGSLEDGLVPVGRGVEQDQLLALLDGGAAQLDVAGGGAGHVLDRRDPAQHLLDRAGHEASGSAARRASWSGLGQQFLHAAADDVAGGLVAPDEDEQRLVDERVVVERVAVDLGVAEHADQVVGGARGPAVLEDRVDVVRVLVEGGWPPTMASGSGEPWDLSMSSDQRSRSSRSVGATPSMSPMTMMGSGAAMSVTKSQLPCSQTRVDDGVAGQRGGCPPWPAPAWG